MASEGDCAWRTWTGDLGGWKLGHMISIKLQKIIFLIKPTMKLNGSFWDLCE